MASDTHSRPSMNSPKSFTSACISIALLAAANLVLSAALQAGVVASWDFGTGSPAPVAGIAGVQVDYLPNTAIYQYVGGPSNPAQLAFGTTDSFGISRLSGAPATVMKIPDMRAAQVPAVGLMASFPKVANGLLPDGSAATKLNRYTFLADILVPAVSFTGAPAYLDLFQPRGNADGALFLNKVRQDVGAATSYGGHLDADRWYRLAMVMRLDAPTSESRYEVYVDGQKIGGIVPDQIVVSSQRDQDLKDRDLIVDGGWSLGTAADSLPGLAGNRSAFFAFNDNNSEVGELYAASMQFHDVAFSAAEIAALGGANPGPIQPVPEPSAAAIAAAAAAGLVISRRRFALASTAAAAGIISGAACGQEAAVERADMLSEYVGGRDPSTSFTPIADGQVAGGRWRTGRLVSQTWQGRPWTHELSMFLPGDMRRTGHGLLWVDGGSQPNLPAEGLREPTESIRILAAAANATGLPAAVVRQVPFQPMFDGLREDGLISHTFVEYVRTGDPSWPLLLPMVKSVAEAMTAVTADAKEQWDISLEEFVVAGASKRGWTTWLTAAVDDRVAGIVPMVIDMLSLSQHLQLQVDSFGGLSEKLHDYTSRGIDRLLTTPRGRELVEIVDPYAYRDRLTLPKIIALGTNDPYWPLESLDLYYDGLPGPRWVSYCPNADHSLPAARILGLVAGLGRHVAGIESMPVVDWRFDEAGPDAAVVVRCERRPDQIRLWSAASESRDFRSARWSQTPIDGAGPEWRAALSVPASGYRAALVELEFDREPVSLALTTGVHVSRAV